jgi:hypothetical protein
MIEHQITLTSELDRYIGKYVESPDYVFTDPVSVISAAILYMHEHLSEDMPFKGLDNEPTLDIPHSREPSIEYRIILKPDLDRFVADLISSGRFGGTEEVFLEAMKHLRLELDLCDAMIAIDKEWASRGELGFVSDGLSPVEYDNAPARIISRLENEVKLREAGRVAPVKGQCWDKPVPEQVIGGKSRKTILPSQ